MPTRPDGRFLRLLRVEELEHRNPASTTLDVLLAGAGLPLAAASSPETSPETADDLARFGGESPWAVVDDRNPENWVSVASDPTDEPKSLAPSEPVSFTPVHTWFGDEELASVSSSQPVPVGAAGLLLIAPPFASGASQSAPAITPAAPAAVIPQDGTVFAGRGIDQSDSPPQFVKLAGSEGPVQPNAIGPGIFLTADTNSIPVNANNTSKSLPKKDAYGTPQPGLPAIRDFDLSPMRDLTGWDGKGNPPAGAAITDPELKKLTATVTGGQPGGDIQVDIIYANPATGGRIRIWTDATKTIEITSGGTLPLYPTSDFYVEGIRPSAAENDITVRVRSTQPNVTVFKETQLTVVPFAVSMVVQTRNPATVTLMKDNAGRVVGLNSGQQNPANGGAVDSLTPGALFLSYVWTTGAGEGVAEYVQNVLGVGGNQPGVSLTNNFDYIHYLQDQATYPILDYVPNPLPVPFYPLLDTDNSVPNQVGLITTDTPFMANPSDPLLFANLISSMDLTFQARLYTVWQFADGTIYTLATVDWQVVFKASLVNGVLTPDTSAIVSAQPFVRTGQDPETVVIPTYNEKVGFTLWG